MTSTTSTWSEGGGGAEAVSPLHWTRVSASRPISQTEPACLHRPTPACLFKLKTSIESGLCAMLDLKFLQQSSNWQKLEQEQCHRRPNEIWDLIYVGSENSLKILC